MTVAQLSVSSADLLSLDTDVLVIGVKKTENGPVLLSDSPELASIQHALESIGVTGAQDEVRRLPAVQGAARSLALVGVGSGDPTPDDLRYAAGSVARQLRGIDSLAIALPTATGNDVLAVLEGAAIGAYSYTEYRHSSLEATKLPASTIVVVSTVAGGAELAARATAIATAVHTVRDLVNAPPSDLYPETFAARAVELAAGTGVTVTVLAEKELAAGGYGGILGVGQGSTRGPRLVKAVYSPAGATKHVALVGKGITFDSGGLSLKPAASMAG
ncbi:MAG: M17 family peptidase N-terminal domain-containing protein, partial [Rhodoglobus sp.]